MSDLIKIETEDFELYPSLPAQNFAELTSALTAVKDVAGKFQIDFVDGNFTDTSATWPFSEKESDFETITSQLRPFVHTYILEADLMVSEPSQYFQTLVDLGFKSVVLHHGSSSEFEADLENARNIGFEVGIGITNDFDLASADRLFNKADFVQLMGIQTIGKQGQPFDDRTPKTIKNILSSVPNICIAVDGSVNAETIQILRDAGAKRFAPGSAVLSNEDPVCAFLSLQTLLAN